MTILSRSSLRFYVLLRVTKCHFLLLFYFFLHTLTPFSSQSLSISLGDLLNTSLKNMFSSAPFWLLSLVHKTCFFPFPLILLMLRICQSLVLPLVQFLYMPLLSSVCMSACASSPSTSILLKHFFLSLFLPLDAET